MRTLILFAAMTIATAAILPNEADGLLRALLRDIPASELSTASQAESISDIRSIIRERAERLADAETDASQCRPACVEAAAALETICERHVLAEASMSRAVCYGRVDDDRTVCLLACDE
jgi:hypothetical protein